MIAASEDIAPDAIKMPRMARLTLMPENRAAPRLFPMAYSARPQRVACRKIANPINRDRKINELHGIGLSRRSFRTRCLDTIAETRSFRAR